MICEGASANVWRRTFAGLTGSGGQRTSWDEVHLASVYRANLVRKAARSCHYATREALCEGEQVASVAGGSGGQELRVHTDTLGSASDQLQSIADELRDGLRRLVSQAERVIEGTWRGEAATAFSKEWDEFREAAESIVEDADVIAGLVSLSVTHYVNDDDTSAEMLRATWSRLA